MRPLQRLLRLRWNNRAATPGLPIHLIAIDWLLRHPEAAPLSQLTHELGTITTLSGAANPPDRLSPRLKLSREIEPRWAS